MSPNNSHCRHVKHESNWKFETCLRNRKTLFCFIFSNCPALYFQTVLSEVQYFTWTQFWQARCVHCQSHLLCLFENRCCLKIRHSSTTTVCSVTYFRVTDFAQMMIHKFSAWKAILVLGVSWLASLLFLWWKQLTPFLSLLWNTWVFHCLCVVIPKYRGSIVSWPVCIEMCIVTSWVPWGLLV